MAVALVGVSPGSVPGQGEDSLNTSRLAVHQHFPSAPHSPPVNRKNQGSEKKSESHTKVTQLING